MHGRSDRFPVFINTAVIQAFHDAQFVAGRSVELQGLRKVGDLALLFRQCNRQPQIMSRQLFADKMNLGANQLKKLEPLSMGREQLIQFNDRMIELA